jgi:hypothetical protein
MTNSYSYSNGVSGSVTECDITSTSGSTDPNSNYNSNSWRVRGQAPGNGWNLMAPQYSQGVEFDVNTTGRYHIVFQYDWYVTAQGIRDLQAQYTADGTTWTNVGSVQVTPDGGDYDRFQGTRDHLSGK